MFNYVFILEPGAGTCVIMFLPLSQNLLRGRYMCNYVFNLEPELTCPMKINLNKGIIILDIIRITLINRSDKSVFWLKVKNIITQMLFLLYLELLYLYLN
jgi:hypothetical protein